MKQRGAAIAVFIGIFVILAQGQPKQGIAQSKSTPSAKKAADPTQGQQCAASEAIERLIRELETEKQQNTQDHQAQENRAQQEITIERKLVEYTRALVWVGVVQALILGVTIGVLYLQVRTSRNIERAWINVEIVWGPGRMGIDEHNKRTDIFLECVCNNQGKTPGWVTEIKARFLSDKEGLPIEPDLEKSQIILNDPEPVMVGGEIGRGHLFTLGSNGLIKADHPGVLYGVVKYRTVFDTEHFTFFGYDVPVGAKNLRRIRGYPQYNRAT